MTEPTRRNTYGEMATICGMLRKMHLEMAKDTSELAIDVDDDVFRAIMATVPPEMQYNRTMGPTRWNELLIGGVIVRGRPQGMREEEDHMLKRGFRKAWVAGEVK